ncbi:MAG: VWA domain-containing protein [Microbacteriaceae bacterium]|nr:MAG: VWA domain-containing protein [Microbacteriaceae bacterium]
MTTHIAIDHLDQLASLLSAELRLRLIPGTAWGVNRLQRVITYPRSQLLAMEQRAAIGALWRTVQHAFSSVGKVNAFDLAVDAALAAEAAIGARTVHPTWILNIVLGAERERVEAIARRRARNLANTYLPAAGRSFRQGEREGALEIVQSQPKNAKGYWARIATAVAGVASGMLTSDDLPADMPWDAATIDAVRTLVDLPSYDALLVAVEQLVPRFARDQARALANQPPPPPQPNTDSDGNDCDEAQSDSSAGEQSDDVTDDTADDSASGSIPENAEGNNEGDGGADDEPSRSEDVGQSEPDDEPVTDADSKEDGDKDQLEESNGTVKQPDSNNDTGDQPTSATESSNKDGEADADSFDIPQEIIDAIKGELDAQGDERHAIDYFEGAVTEEGQTTEDQAAAQQEPQSAAEAHHDPLADRSTPAPSWSAVGRSNARIRGVLNRVIGQHLVENEIGELIRGTNGGRFDWRRAMYPSTAGTPPFRRRSSPDDRSYTVALIVDISGSMILPVPDAPAYPETFGGEGLHRWHLSTRLTVALCDALQALPRSEVIIIGFDDNVEVLKTATAPLTAATRQHIMDELRPRGWTTPAKAIERAADEMARAHGEQKLTLLLTDGDFQGTGTDVHTAINRLRAVNSDLAVFTLGCGPESARRFVPVHMADEVTDDSVGRVLARHLKRLLGTR